MKSLDQIYEEMDPERKARLDARATKFFEKLESNRLYVIALFVAIFVFCTALITILHTVGLFLTGSVVWSLVFMNFSFMLIWFLMLKFTIGKTNENK